MKRQPSGLYAIALAVLIIGLVSIGVPASTLLIAALVLSCPLMMLVMMRSMHGGGSNEHRSSTPLEDPARRHEDETRYYDADRQ